MLILSRRTQERLILGQDIFITILGVKGNRVRIGIDAPNSLTVHREEIHQKIKNAETFLFANEG
jgi:carbon storage regulator